MSQKNQFEEADIFQYLVNTLRVAKTERGLTIFQIHDALEEVLTKEEKEVLKELL